MPVAYKGRLGGQFVNRYGKKVYKSFQERVGPRGGKYFIRGRDHHKVYHSTVKPRNLGFRGEHNELKRKIYGGKRGGLVVIKVTRGGAMAPGGIKYMRPKISRNVYMKLLGL
jgi:hypothetical protein